MTDILIRNGFIATMDRQRTVYRRGSLYVKDDRIVEVGEAVNVLRSPEYVIDKDSQEGWSAHQHKRGARPNDCSGQGRGNHRQVLPRPPRPEESLGAESVLHEIIPNSIQCECDNQIETNHPLRR